LPVVDALEIPYSVALLFFDHIIKSTKELKLIRFDPAEFFAFLNGKVKRNQLIFGNRLFDSGFDVFANEVMLHFNKCKEADQLIEQKSNKTKKNEFAHLQR